MAVLNNTGILLYLWRNIETRSCNRCYSGNAESITYSECGFVTLGIHIAFRKRHIILSYVVCPSLQYSSRLSHKWHKFRKTVTEHKQLLNTNSYWTQNVLSFPLRILCEIFYVLRRTERDLIKNVLWSVCTLPAVVCSTGCCVQYRLLCTLPAVVCSTGCCVQYRLLCRVPAVVYSTGCCVQYRLLCTVPAVECSNGCCVHYRLLCSVPAVVCSTGCCVEYRLLCAVPAVVYITGCCVQYRLLCTVPAVVYITGCCVQYRLLCTVPAVVYSTGCCV
jgi:hypothetical protein